jgi:hypothetical protein
MPVEPPCSVWGPRWGYRGGGRDPDELAGGADEGKWRQKPTNRGSATQGIRRTMNDAEEEKAKAAVELNSPAAIETSWT